jgi:preprotein translocase subunit SecF
MIRITGNTCRIQNKTIWSLPYFLICLFLTGLFSGCSTSSFLQRQYTPGVFVQHRAHVPAAGSELAETVDTKATNQMLLKPEAGIQNPEKISPPLVRTETKPQTVQPGNTRIQADKKWMVLKRILPDPYMGFFERKPEKGIVMSQSKDQKNKVSPVDGADDEAGTSFTQGMSAIIFFALSILVYVVLKHTAFVGIQAAALLSALHIFFIFCAVVLFIIGFAAVVYGVKAIRHARAQGSPVPPKAIIGMVLAIASVLLLLLFASLVLVL